MYEFLTIFFFLTGICSIFVAANTETYKTARNALICLSTSFALICFVSTKIIVREPVLIMFVITLAFYVFPVKRRMERLHNSN